ncbi:MAG: hypothetical protein LBR87_03075 [Synergistaceae bacterium]|jgi:hypothetical protein|nr:hypothetical protein [Synergistaceae bacterium]
MCSITAALSGVGAVSQIYQGYGANKAAQAQADAAMRAAEQNARIARFQASDAVKRGGAEEAGMRRQFDILRGRREASAAAAGIQTDSGSMKDIQEASVREEERDVSVNALNHAREAWGYSVQAENYLYEGASRAASLRSQGYSALGSGVMGGVTGLLSLVSPMAGKTTSSRAIKVDPNQYASPIGPRRFTGGLGAVQSYDRLFSR